MKKTLLGLIGVSVISFASHSLHAEDSAKQAELKARAKISETQARATALDKVPNGTVKEIGLEEENGKLIYSLDITTPGTNNITEVAVDAINGAIVDVSTETPKDQAKEAAADMKEAKKAKASKEKDEDDEKEDKGKK
jgi:Peptidase propeptide and YPEB domain